MSRRLFLQAALGLISGAFIWPARASTAMKHSEMERPLIQEQWFDETQAEAVLTGLTGGRAESSPKVHLEVPALIEDGTRIRIRASSELEQTEAMALVIHNNPLPLVMVQWFTPECEAYIQCNVRMAGSSPVSVIAFSKEGDFMTQKDVQVLVGACGV